MKNPLHIAIEQPMTTRILGGALGILALIAAHAAEPEIGPAELPRVPATPPEQALGTFFIKPGLRLELVAAEPLVVDPIAMSFDESGRLYVVEMRDYSERRPERLGRIRLLEDTDGDGRFDQSSVFADDLPWPTAVVCWDGGVFVGATPDILYFKDTNRDGVSDVREIVFSGFASDYAPYATNKLNVQAMMNSFQWTLDNRIHGASGGSGGKVRRLDSPFTREWRQRAGVRTPPVPQAPPPVDLRGKDFSFDPRTLEIRAESGGAQHGMSFDDVGRKFVCSNSDHIQQVLYEDRYLGPNTWFTPPPPRVSIAADGPAAPVFRRSPDEPWRVIRTKWRVSGAVPGIIEGGGRPSGYFTGATGATIYRGDALGEEYVGDAFIADCGSNLVHRKKLRSSTNSLALIAERDPSEQSVEFLASTDNWFRPVQFANAPDGALYIADMYREVIEHPWSLPESIKKHLDLNSGSDRGRIYRIVRENYQQRPLPRLSLLSAVELVPFLEHPNGWHRDTAARLLYQRQDLSAIPALQELAISGTGLSRMHALYVLSGLGALTENLITHSLGSTYPQLRRHALRLAETFAAAPSESLVAALRNLAASRNLDADSLSVDFQLAWTLGRVRPTDRDAVADQFLGRLYREGHPGVRQTGGSGEPSSWFQPALMNSLGSDPVDVLRRTIGRSGPALPLPPLTGNRPGRMPQLPTTGRLLGYEEQRAIVAKFARLVGTRNASNEVRGALAELEKTPANSGRAGNNLSLRVGFEYLASLAEGLEEGGGSVSRHIGGVTLTNLVREARRIALDSKFPGIPDRLLALRALASLPEPADRTNLLALVTAPVETSEIRMAALTALNRPAFGDAARDIIQRWPQLLPAQRTLTIETCLKRADRTRALLAGLESGAVRANELSIAQQTALRSHRDAAIRDQAVTLLGKAATGSRDQAVEKFRPALSLAGSAANGQKLFTARCATCHKLGGEGHALGPDLASVRSNGKEKLLTSIIDPNREVAPAFAGYEIETKDGESVTGILASESASAVLLRQAGGLQKELARANIVSLRSEGRSLMPEGLEEGLTAQDMADLLEYVLTAK